MLVARNLCPIIIIFLSDCLRQFSKLLLKFTMYADFKPYKINRRPMDSSDDEPDSEHLSPTTNTTQSAPKDNESKSNDIRPSIQPARGDALAVPTKIVQKATATMVTLIKSATNDDRAFKSRLLPKTLEFECMFKSLFCVQYTCTLLDNFLICT